MSVILSGANVSTSGLSAERLRMETIANNIANANTTRGEGGLPFRRKDVIFSTVYDETNGQSVRAEVVEANVADAPQVYDPDHPDANAEGFVTMPDVSIADEMVNLISANRGYEANLKVLHSFKEMAQQALSLLQRI